MKKSDVLFMTLCFCASNLSYANPIPSMMSGDSAASNAGWQVSPIFTVGQKIGEYRAPGVLDGLGAFAVDQTTVRILANHEFQSRQGYPYRLQSGAILTGARISYFDIDRETFEVKGSGLAYKNIYDRNGQLVKSAKQLNKSRRSNRGIDRLCSGRSVSKGLYQFEDNLFFAGEEIDNGTQWVLDVDKQALWAFPAMGRGAWENVTPIDSGRDDTVMLVAGDDREAAPLYLYIGKKNFAKDSSFLDRNGLKHGALYCWKSNNGDRSPESFNGFNQQRAGHFVSLIQQEPAYARRAGYDSNGYLDASALRSQAKEKGCFTFSRPEDLHENPAKPTQIIFASTGRGKLFPKDNWGTLYMVDFDLTQLSQPKALITIIHDADALEQPELGIRNPDNLTWGYDGTIYVQEDRSVYPKKLFGGAQKIEASVWQLDPITKNYTRIGEINRNAVYPFDASDVWANDVGNWESSGILDVTPLFKTKKNETLLIGTVQAHSVTNGSIEKNGLVQASQLFYMKKRLDLK